MNISRDLKLKLYQDLLMVRRTEEIVAEEYRKGTIRTPTHFGVGQEAIAVGVCNALNVEDIVYTHHRSHNHYLAKGGDPYRFMAELFGREDGCAGGRGGSVHIIDKAAGFWGSSPILGHSIALAVGASLAFSMDNDPRIAVAFFGEGALDEGSVWESFNFAAIRNLPVVFICENNLYATESPMSVRIPSEVSICEKVKSFGIDATQVDGNDVEGMYLETKLALDKCKNNGGPVFLECMTYRWLEHVGPMFDYELKRNYRSKEELLDWQERCPVTRMEQKLLKDNVLVDGEIGALREKVDETIFATLDRASRSPWPVAKDLFNNVI